MLLSLSSCNHTDNDSTKTCTGNCNVIIGRFCTEDHVGLAHVDVLFYYTLNSIGINYQRIIGRTTTDSNGNYRMEVFIKDAELGGLFFIQTDTAKIESLLSDAFVKPSDLVSSSFSSVGKCPISNLYQRTQVITMDFRVPFKTTQEVHLNNFAPQATGDYFAVGSQIRYGFQTDFNQFLTKQSGNGYSYAEGLNTTVQMVSVFGDNTFTILRIKNNVVERTNETVSIATPNPNNALNYEY